MNCSSSDGYFWCWRVSNLYRESVKIIEPIFGAKIETRPYKKYPCCDDRRNRGTSWYWRVSILYRESVQFIEPIFGAQTEAVSTENTPVVWQLIQ